MKYIFLRMAHSFDHVCPECQQVLVPFWQRRCSFCDKGDGLMEGDLPQTKAQLSQRKLPILPSEDLSTFWLTIVAVCGILGVIWWFVELI